MESTQKYLQGKIDREINKKFQKIQDIKTWSSKKTQRQKPLQVFWNQHLISLRSSNWLDPQKQNTSGHTCSFFALGCLSTRQPAGHLNTCDFVEGHMLQRMLKVTSCSNFHVVLVVSFSPNSIADEKKHKIQKPPALRRKHKPPTWRETNARSGFWPGSQGGWATKKKTASRAYNSPF